MTEENDLSTRLESCYTGVIHDVMRKMGLNNFVLPYNIQPLLPDRSLAGPVFTVSGHVDETLDDHQTYIEWTGFLSKAKFDHVVVCQPNDISMAHMGELSAETLNARGVRGYIVDGGCRDVSFIAKLGFRVYCRYFTPLDIVGSWAPDGFDVPIRIGDVPINPGDYICADRDGVCVIPQNQVDEITARAEADMQTEDKVRSAILQGVDPQEAYLKYRKF
ncbi:MAG: RraA family protein [Arenicellales bacterium]|nr:RraA family protein [Arenicellales bacterium]